MKTNKVVSLFSGGGGLDYGFLQKGYDIIWAIDNDKNAVATYKQNIGDHIIHEDINAVDIGAIPQADIIIGGPPCQSFSLSGKRDISDERGQLVWRYLDIISELRPKAFVFENVTGLLSARDKDKNKVADLLKVAFNNLGYSAEMKVLNAAEFGVPQKRKRVIIVGLLNGDSFKFPNPTHGGDENGLKPFVTVKDALNDLPQSVEGINEVAYYKTEPMNEYQKSMRSDSPITEHFTPTMSELDKYIIKHVKPGGNYMDIPSDVPSKRIQRLQRDGGHTTSYGRMHPDQPSYTINTYFNRPNVGCNIHYKEDRLITVREALRLQSFPDSFKLISSSKQGRNTIVGNAVPPLLSSVIAKELLNYIS